MIFVTGGAGFIGSNFILDWLEDRAEPIVCLDKLTYAGNIKNLSSLAHDPRFIFVKGDIGDLAQVGQLLKEYRPRVIVNFAAESHVDRSIKGPYNFVQTNIVGTFFLLEAAKEYFQGLSEREQKEFRYIHVSTDEVYGSLEGDDPSFQETTPYAPNSPYAASKAASDHLVRAWHHTYGVPIIITNCSNNYGPFQFPEKLIPLLISKGLGGQDMPIYGQGLQIRDWLYVEDHCAALRLVIERGKIAEKYNIGGNCELKNIQVATMICELLDEFRPLKKGRYGSQIKFVSDRPGHDYRYAINSNKIRQELGWVPSESFQTGLRKTVQWYLDHAGWLSQS